MALNGVYVNALSLSALFREVADRNIRPDPVNVCKVKNTTYFTAKE